MNDDVRRIIYGTIIGFLLVVGSWLSLIFISSCGFSLSCNQAAPIVIRTSIPTLIPVSHSQNQGGESATTEPFDACQVSATDLIGAWVTADSPESEAFSFTDVNGNPCEGTFADDIQHLFSENSFWYPGSIGCTSCHNAELTERSGGLDLSTYQGIMAGTNRSYAGATGTDILGGGNWDASLLHDVLLVHGLVPTGHSPDAEPIGPVFLYAGQQITQPTGTPALTPTP
jgi:hypothetical protein